MTINYLSFSDDALSLVVGSTRGFSVYGFDENENFPLNIVHSGLNNVNIKIIKIWGSSCLMGVVGTSDLPILTDRTLSLMNMEEGSIISTISFPFPVKDISFSKDWFFFKSLFLYILIV
jgi:hypothetical protein